MFKLSEKMPTRDDLPLRWLAALILRVSNWKFYGELPNERKVVVCAAPHCSNWDFVFAAALIIYYRIDVTIMMKQEAFFWPLANFFRRLGFVPIDRKAPQGAVGEAIRIMHESESCWLVMTPEGTRKRVKRWKSGFLRIAHEADVPISLLVLDYQNKLIRFEDLVQPSGNIKTQLEEIMAKYDKYKLKYD
ncbi:MAG: 1-acyl-sn-glycerol-3-phosphate acyltransferase [Gammaproteobacteria bacterium]|nr:1-acyl-sn-glycerol-3-phosphate acyltransferase [Gammaproteobacteria bacterium]NND40081.1 acyltransferase [Pseudomonadales bacterium]MBT8150130.1 1-acyl-sn-glycerol-3-phosphate acyltransferase [Gammaproteobacteria bacterium]NNL10933.1 acyltransferase [Pseudomonadales bacterium]NNM10943.1 acyltransferase [Pseudomonadales bacterium]